MDFDQCALSYLFCSCFLIVIIYLSLCLPVGILTICHYIYVAIYSRRKEKKYSAPLDNDVEPEVQGQGSRKKPKEKAPDEYSKNIRYIYRTWDIMPLYIRLYWVFRYSVLIALLFTISIIIVLNRGAYLLHSRDLKDQQTDLLVKSGMKMFSRLQKNNISVENVWQHEQPVTVSHNELIKSIISAKEIKGLVQNPQNDANNMVDEEVAEPKAAALKAGDEATSSKRLDTEGKLDESMKRFQQLVGYKVQYYISQKSSTFNITGNLNFWKYFLHRSQHQNLSHLKKSVPLEDDKTIEDIFFLSDISPVRVSADNQFLLYDSQINGPDFEQLTRSHKITIATQTSMDRLLEFVASYEFWTGPISLAVFLTGPLEYFLFRSYLLYLKLCYPKYYRQTRFSIATPIKNPIPRNILITTRTFDEFDCRSSSDDIEVVFKKQLSELKAWLLVKYYPQNMMRNLAIVNVRTDYHLTLDVDIIPCNGMSEKLNKFLNDSFLASALVIPTYEISRKVGFPQTKRELVSLTKKKLAQPFHKDVFSVNQNATNFPKWERIHDSFEDVHIVHEVQLFPIFYEPFLVELYSNPLFDETFLGYGFTRSSHAFEVFVRNGNFLVLSPIFMAELGIKKVKEWSTFRQQQNESNRKRFNHFIANITSQFLDVQKVKKKGEYYLHNFSNFTIY